MAVTRTSRWTCDRCGRAETIDLDGKRKEPKNWIRVTFSALSNDDDVAFAGHLCNPCGGRLIDFIHGRDKEAAEADRRVAETLERLNVP